MTCGGCVRGVTKAIRTVDSDAQVSADLETKNVKVVTSLPRAAFEDALAKADFTVSPLL